MPSQAELGKVVSDPFTVGTKRWRDASTVFLVLGVIVFAIAVIIMIADKEASAPALIAGGIGLACAAVAVGVALCRKAQRSTITVHENGLFIDQGEHKKGCVFGEIAAVGQTTKNHFANGRYSGRSRCVGLWRREDGARTPHVEIHAYCKASDPADEQLNDLVVMLVDRVADRIAELVARGGSAKGEGVQLRQDALRAGDVTIPLDDIAATGFYRDRLCVWRRNEDEPCVRLDPSLPNVLPIVQVLDTELEKRQAAGEESEAEEGLGRILFERRASRVIAWVVLLAGLPLCLVLIGFLLILIAMHLFRSRFRAHERGVLKRGLFKERSLRYTDVDTFTCSTTSMYVNGVYTGTSVVMKFVPEPGADVKPVKFSQNVRNADSDLDALRDHISAVVARKMLDRYKADGRLEWTPDVIFTQDGIRYRKGKLIGKGEWDELPFEQIAGATLNEGQFFLFAEGQEKHVLRMPSSTDNFFPGSMALSHLLAEKENAETPA